MAIGIIPAVMDTKGISLQSIQTLNRSFIETMYSMATMTYSRSDQDVKTISDPTDKLLRHHSESYDGLAESQWN